MRLNKACLISKFRVSERSRFSSPRPTQAQSAPSFLPEDLDGSVASANTASDALGVTRGGGEVDDEGAWLPTNTLFFGVRGAQVIL